MTGERHVGTRHTISCRHHFMGLSVDEGSEATFAALADRGLVQVDWRDANVWGQRKPYLRLTPVGPRLGCSGTGQKAYKAPPAGTLKEWH